MPQVMYTKHPVVFRMTKSLQTLGRHSKPKNCKLSDSVVVDGVVSLVKHVRMSSDFCSSKLYLPARLMIREEDGKLFKTK